MSRIGVAAFGAGLAGLAVAAAGWALDAPRFYASWLSALVFVAGWPLGSLALLMIHALTGGAWGDALRPALRTGVAALPVLVPAAAVLACGLSPLYPWARSGSHFDNAFYLDVPFFASRGVAYLLIWLALGVAVWRDGALMKVAPAGLFVLALTVTFASIDTTMSLDPHFTSSIYGMIQGAGTVLLALSVAVVLSVRTAPAPVRKDLGKLLLALVVLWIYLDFMQLLIVWQSDLSAEAPWYVARSRGSWGAVRVAIALGHFLIPFFLLLRPSAQSSARIVVGVSVLLIAMEAARYWWTVLPSLGVFVDWIDVGCMVALSGLALATGLFIVSRPRLALRHA